MSTESTRRMIELYNQNAGTTAFFSGFFRSPRRNFYSSQGVEIDIVRSDEDVAVAIQDLSVGPRMNAADIYTNKQFIPPVFDEAIPLNSFDLLKRMPGRTPFQDPNFRGAIVTRVFDGMQKIERKIRRAIELQSSQVIQTGTVVASDKNGNEVYGIDFSPKATHFPTTGVSWATATGAQMLADIEALVEVIRDDGLADPDQLIFGITAFKRFIGNADVRARFDTRRIDEGSIGRMEIRGEGGRYRGQIDLGNYKLDVWTYNGKYKHPQTGTKTPYMDPDKVVARASDGRLDATFGDIPNIGKILGMNGANLVPDLPSRISNGAGSMDLHTNVWLTNDGKQLVAGVGSRPLMIPTAIDTFGCLLTIP